MTKIKKVIIPEKPDFDSVLALFLLSLTDRLNKKVEIEYRNSVTEKEMRDRKIGCINTPHRV